MIFLVVICVGLNLILAVYIGNPLLRTEGQAFYFLKLLLQKWRKRNEHGLVKTLGENIKPIWLS